MRVQGAGDKEVRNGNPEGNFRPDQGQRGEGGRGNTGANVEVGHYGEDCIKSCGKDLKRPSGLGGVSLKGQSGKKWRMVDEPSWHPGDSSFPK